MINSFNVSYADFQLDQIINPDEFDVNFADIAIRMNQIIDVLNQITDGINGNGAEIIDIGEITPFLSGKLQGFLQELVDKLHGEEGAEFIGTLPISGLSGTTVQEQLVELSTLLAQLRDDLTSNVNRLDYLVATNASDITTLDSRLTANEAKTNDLDNIKADQDNVYTKLESDTLLSDLEESIYTNVYDKDETDSLLANKVDIDGNFEGTWNGLTISDLAPEFGISGVVIDTVPPNNPTEKLLWFNPSNNQYTIYLNGEWRVNGTPMKIVQVHHRVVLEEEASVVPIGITSFHPKLDAVFVAQNGIFIAPEYDYEISSDGSTITNLSGTWQAGTVLDFTAHISTPAT